MLNIKIEITQEKSKDELLLANQLAKTVIRAIVIIFLISMITIIIWHDEFITCLILKYALVFADLIRQVYVFNKFQHMKKTLRSIINVVVDVIKKR